MLQMSKSLTSGGKCEAVKMGDDKSGINVEQESDSQFPLVLQCSQCNLIVGDSKSWVSANNSLKSITLKCVTDKVQIENKISVSSTGSDAGSTYKLLKCTGCESRLGVQYLATPPEFDQFRNCFTLDVKKITSYQVGSEGQTSGNSSDLHRLISMDDVCKEIRKVQILMVEFGERILALEQKQNISYHGDSQSDVDITDNEQVLSTSKDHSSQQKRKLSSGPGGPTKKAKSK